MVEGDDARAAIAESGRKTTSRRDLSRSPGFDEVSPEVGELDPDAFADLLDEDPDAALSLLADLTGATDEGLRRLALDLAGRIVVDLARTPRHPRPGVGRLRVGRWRGEGDLDLDSSMEEIAAARALRRAPEPEGLRATAWTRPPTALCLLVDRSGSMTGERLATAAVTAAAVAYRHPDSSVVAFSDEAIVVTATGQRREPAEVAGDLLRLRGHGTTDVGLALRVAGEQLSRAPAGRRVAVLLSDCRSTTGDDPALSGGAVDELVILAPRGDRADADRLADAVGAKVAEIDGPSSAPQALHDVLA